MGIEHILFLLYLALILWRVPQLNFVKSTTLNRVEISGLLAFKILAGFLTAYYFKNILPGSDYVLHNEEGLIQYNLLLKDPLLFFTDFRADLNRYGAGGIFEASNSFWGYLRFYIFYKYLAIQNLVTRGDYYLNAAFFSSVIFWGQLLFYKIFYDVYKRNKYQILIVCFCIPSLLLFTSIPHKDGLVFLSISVTSFCIYKYLSSGMITLRTLLLFGISITWIFLLRNFILVAILPAMTASLIATRVKRRPVAAIFGIYIIFTALFFATGNFTGSGNLPEAVVKRKADFALLEKGDTDLPMSKLEPTAKSFFISLPTAVNHVLLRPYPFEFNMAVTLAALEIYIYLLLFILFLLSHRKYFFKKNIHPFNIFGIAFSCTMIIIIGLTIPNAGAIIRYRSILWIFLLPPVICKLTDQFRTIRSGKSSGK